MTLAAEPSRRLVAKLNGMLDKNILVRLSSGKTYKGKLVGFDINNLNMVLEAVEDSEGNRWALVLIGGHSVSEVILEEGSVFDAKEFAEYLVTHGNIGRHLIKVYEDVNIVEVGKIVRVTASGVEGTGPMAQKVHTLFMEYLRSKGLRV